MAPQPQTEAEARLAQIEQRIAALEAAQPPATFRARIRRLFCRVGLHAVERQHFSHKIYCRYCSWESDL